jgi:HlyD family secretion protein
LRGEKNPFFVPPPRRGEGEKGNPFFVPPPRSGEGEKGRRGREEVDPGEAATDRSGSPSPLRGGGTKSGVTAGSTMKKLIIILLLGLVGAGGFGFWYTHRVNGSSGAFRTEVVSRGDLLSTISATGTIQAEEVVDIGAQVAGQIIAFGKNPKTGHQIDYGSAVEEGDILAQIDDTLFRARVRQAEARLSQMQRKVDQSKTKVDQAEANVLRAEADLKVAQAKFRQAQRDWDRVQRVRTSSVVSQQEQDAALANLETSQAGVGVAEASVTQARAALKDSRAAVADAEAAAQEAEAARDYDKRNLEYTTIRSPIKGVIISRRVTLGQTVQSSFNAPSLFLLAKDLTRVKIWVSVNEADLGRVHVGQKVRFNVDSYPHETFVGVVDRIRLDATMNQNVVTYPVEVVTDNKDQRLRPYQTANVQFEVGQRKNALLVPNAALRWRPSSAQVAPAFRDEYARSLGRKGQPAPASGKEAGTTTVWLEDAGFVRPVRLRLGMTDGLQTEVVEGDVREGTELVSGEMSPTGSGGKGGGGNPFTPQPFRRGG